MQSQNINLLATNPDIERFLSKVSIPDNPNDCWEWQAYKFPSGYGNFYLKNHSRRAHRIAYFLFKGEPGNLCVLHKCDNPACVNPDHLRLGTDADNVSDMCQKKRNIARKGEQSGQCKFSDSKIEQVFNLQGKGYSHRQIASFTGISKSQVGRIIRKEHRNG